MNNPCVHTYINRSRPASLSPDAKRGLDYRRAIFFLVRLATFITPVSHIETMDNLIEL